MPLPERHGFAKKPYRSEEHTSELQSQSNLVCRLLLEKKIFRWKIAKVPMGPMDYWLISHKDASENNTMAGLYKKTMSETGFLNHFSVVNIDQSLAKATNLGAKVVKGKEEIPNIGWFAVLQDPDNNAFALFQASGRM